MLYIIAALIGFVVAGLHGAAMGILIIIGIDVLFVVLLGVGIAVCAIWQGIVDIYNGGKN